MSVFVSESPGNGILPMSTLPWDSKADKNNVIEWHSSGWVEGDVLDTGHRFGDNAIYLTKNGFKVNGLDISLTAFIAAEWRAKDAEVEVAFAVTDSTKLDSYINIVINSGMFHWPNDDGKRSYAATIYRATRPDATLLINCFSDDNPSDVEQPLLAFSRKMSQDVLGGANWDIASLEPTTARREQDSAEIEMTFWYVRTQRHELG
ncbi:SAM-dependent methyltransferase [Mycobacterium uberis]|uniref:SAM-dependent methyltransferase n=1 Tax=Mycobacterium uberis TaxID=2162698 RepID=A0A3E1HFD1_9MYCO|nr:class I SAM-dependent methyltransferase [Mycobacterium uberis]RFD25158.1 SAM-dependent methyltransferase [Mycobacterium uberis]